MKPHHDLSVPTEDAPTRAAPGPAATPAQLLAWYRERDHDAEDLHRRYVRARFRMEDWSDEDLRRFHRYRRTVPRERAAQLVIARRYAVGGMAVAAFAVLVAGLIYAAFEWWRRKNTQPALPAAPGNKARAETKP